MRSAREIVEDLIGAWVQNDAHRAAAFFAVDGCYREAGGKTIQGRDAIHAHFARYFREGPMWRLDVDAIVAEAETAAAFYRFAVKGDRERWTERAGCALVRCKDGAVLEWSEYRADVL